MIVKTEREELEPILRKAHRELASGFLRNLVSAHLTPNPATAAKYLRKATACHASLNAVDDKIDAMCGATD